MRDKEDCGRAAPVYNLAYSSNIVVSRKSSSLYRLNVLFYRFVLFWSFIGNAKCIHATLFALANGGFNKDVNCGTVLKATQS